jgi:type I restriction enzyme S subunit
MKDSGVEWLGEVPEGWTVAPLKSVVNLNPESLGESTDSSLIINYIEIGDVAPPAGVNGYKPCAFGDSPSRARRLVQPGDVLISTVRTYLKAIGRVPARANEDPWVASTGFAALRPTRVNSRFLELALSSDSFISKIQANSVGVSYPGIDASKLVRFQLAVPSEREQAKIAAYLDQETSRIDALISKKEQLIEKLLERKQALITQVVTKGLDPNVPMKDSGVEWLGEVPSAWQVKPHWAFLKEKKVPVGNLHSELTLLSLTKQGVIVRDLEAGGKFPTSFEGYQKVAPDDLVLCLFDVEETPRTVGLAPSEGMITSAYTLMRATGINPHFLEWYLIGMDNEKRFKPFYSGLRNTLQKPIFASIRFAVPLSSEQAEIVQYLDKETSQIDSLVEKTRKAIELLKERRQALITQVVTGKIDVRGFAGGNS